MKNRLAALLAMLFVLGVLPATAQPPDATNSARIAAIKSIGIVSAIGDQINVYTVGFSVFNLSTKYHSLADMGIDDMLEAFVREKIGGRFNVVPIHYDRIQFSLSTEPGFMILAAPPPIAELVKSLTAPVDAYLIISKSAVPFGLRDDVLTAGLNMGKGGRSTYSLYAFIDLSLYDGQTQTLLAQSVYPAPISHFWGGTVEQLPLDASLWPDNSGIFTPTQSDALKALLSKSLTKVVSKEIDQMGLLRGYPSSP